MYQQLSDYEMHGILSSSQKDPSIGIFLTFTTKTECNREGGNAMIETFQKYTGSGWILSWFAVAFVFLWFREKEKNNRILFLYAPAVSLLFFFNPLFYNVFSSLTEEAIYFRIMWLMPVTVVIGYAAVKVCEMLKGRQKIAWGLAAALLIVLSGKSVYENPLFERAENEYHVPWEVVEICDAIKIEGREVLAAFPEEFLLYVRQYSSVVCMPYGRESTMGAYSEFRELMLKQDIPVEKLAELAKQNGCHYVILSTNKNLMGEMEEFDYEVFKNVGEYVIYKDVTMNFDTYY